MLHCGCRISRKISSSPLVSGNIQCAAVVRGRPRMFASTVLVAQSTLAQSSFVRIRVHVRFNRREKTGGQQSHVSPSAPKAAEPSAMPFAQRLTCTIDDACEMGAGRIVRTTIGRRRLVVVCAPLLTLLDTNMSN